MNVTVLVDFDNHSVVTALETADALGADLWGVRLDTFDKLADYALQELRRRRRGSARAGAAGARRARRTAGTT